jgi:hypothetical protein
VEPLSLEAARATATAMESAMRAATTAPVEMLAVAEEPAAAPSAAAPLAVPSEMMPVAASDAGELPAVPSGVTPPATPDAAEPASVPAVGTALAAWAAGALPAAMSCAEKPGRRTVVKTKTPNTTIAVFPLVKIFIALSPFNIKRLNKYKPSCPQRCLKETLWSFE